jgi:hypothetical protein
MSGEYVTYDIAIAMKEKGFDGPCNAHYKDNDPDYLVALDNGLAGYQYSWITNKDVVLAPLYQQVIDWLETQKIFVSIEYAAPDTNKFCYRIDNYNGVYRVYETTELGYIPTDKVVGEFGIFSKERYLTRKECTKEAIKAGLVLVGVELIKGALTTKDGLTTSKELTFEENLIQKYPLETLDIEMDKIRALGYDIFGDDNGCQIYLEDKMIIDADFYDTYHLNVAHAIEGFLSIKK